jgi:hypothetical protein
VKKKSIAKPVEHVNDRTERAHRKAYESQEKGLGNRAAGAAQRAMSSTIPTHNWPLVTKSGKKHSEALKTSKDIKERQAKDARADKQLRRFKKEYTA